MGEHGSMSVTAMVYVAGGCVTLETSQGSKDCPKMMLMVRHSNDRNGHFHQILMTATMKEVLAMWRGLS